MDFSCFVMSLSIDEPWGQAKVLLGLIAEMLTKWTTSKKLLYWYGWQLDVPLKTEEKNIIKISFLKELYLNNFSKQRKHLTIFSELWICCVVLSNFVNKICSSQYYYLLKCQHICVSFDIDTVSRLSRVKA